MRKFEPIPETRRTTYFETVNQIPEEASFDSCKVGHQLLGPQRGLGLWRWCCGGFIYYQIMIINLIAITFVVDMQLIVVLANPGHW